MRNIVKFHRLSPSRDRTNFFANAASGMAECGERLKLIKNASFAPCAAQIPMKSQSQRTYRTWTDYYIIDIRERDPHITQLALNTPSYFCDTSPMITFDCVTCA